MTFANPQFLYLLAALPLAIAAAYWGARARRLALARFASPELARRLTGGVNARGRTLASALAILALGLSVIALARPQWGESAQIVERRGIQLMIALDVSRSMLAEDVKPTRLDRAKLEIYDLMRQLDGDEIGLALFAGAAFIQFPLTFDHATARTFLDYANPRAIGRQGTDIEEAIRVSLRGLADDRPSQKAIIIISDGERQEGDARAAARDAAESGVVVFTVGVGEPNGAEVPQLDASGNVLGYPNDGAVLSRINEDELRDIAAAGGGVYVHAGESVNAADRLAEELNSLQRTAMEHEMENVKVERFQLFAAAAVAALIARELIPSRRRGKSQSGDFRREERGVSDEMRPRSAISALAERGLWRNSRGGEG